MTVHFNDASFLPPPGGLTVGGKGKTKSINVAKNGINVSFTPLDSIVNIMYIKNDDVNCLSGKFNF